MLYLTLTVSVTDLIWKRLWDGMSAILVTVVCVLDATVSLGRASYWTEEQARGPPW